MGLLHYEAVCVLQPTSPLRSPATIDRCVALLWERDVDSVISVRPVPPEYNPHWVYFESSTGLLERSVNGPEIFVVKSSPAYHPDGSVFVTRTEVVMGEHSLIGKNIWSALVSPKREAADLDTEEQWRELEQQLHSVYEERISILCFCTA